MKTPWPLFLLAILCLNCIELSAQTLSEWRSQSFGSSADSGNGANMADGDNDHLVNLVEYALLLDPKKPNAIWATVSIEGSELCLTYQRRKAALTEVTFQCLWAISPTGPWSSTGVTESLLSDDGTRQSLKAKVSLSGVSRRFFKIQVTYAPTAPIAPSNLIASPSSNTELDLTWTDNANNESGYKIERRISGGNFSPLTTVEANISTFHDSGLTPGTTYIYRCVATNTGGDSAFSNDARITMPLPVPAAPSNAVATAISSSRINLTWSDNTTWEDGYLIERRQSGMADYNVIAETAPNTTSYSDTGLLEGWKYYYRIAARNAAGTSAYSSIVNATTLSLPAAPSGLIATAVSTSQINLSWTDNASNESAFKVERRQSGTTDFLLIETLGAGVTSYQNSGLPSATRFHYRIAASNSVGQSAYTPSSSADTLPPPPAAPGSLSANAVSSSQINLAWSDNSNNETGFRIERRQSGSPNFTLLTEVGAGVTSYQNAGLPADTRFYYQVYAINGGGNSAMTSIATAVTQPAANGLNGPGVGNLTYSSNEYMQVVSRFDSNSGIPTFGNNSTYGTNVVAMHNGYLAMVFADDAGRGTGGFLFYDISNPRNPVMVNRVYEPSGRTSEIRESHSMGFCNDLGGNHVVLQSGHGLEFWDWTDVRNPQLLSRMALPNMNFGDYEGVVWHLAWQAPYVYCGSSEQGIFIVDASDPRNPRLAQGRSNPIYPGQLGNFRVGPIFAIGNLLVITSMNSQNGYSTLDISDPANPQMLGTTGNGGMNLYYGTTFNGNRIYSSARNTNNDSGDPQPIMVHDVSDPTNIRLIHNSLVIAHGQYGATQDQFFFNGCQSDIVKVDTTNFTIAGRGGLGVENPDNGSVTPIGNLVYVGNDHGSGSGLICHQTSPDNRGPEVNMISPANNSANQAHTSRVGITLTDNIDLRFVNSGSFIVRPLGGSAISGKYSSTNSTVNFWPDQRLSANTTYEVVIPAGGIKDWAGNPTASTFTSRFTTRP